LTSSFRSITGATEYCLRFIQAIKKEMQDLGGKKQKTAMVIGGVIITMTSHLLSLCQEVIERAKTDPTPDLKSDLIEIKTRFNEFLDKMIGD